MNSETNELAEKAYHLADEIRAGLWNHINVLKLKPAPDCQEIIDELSKRCPGHTTDEYKRAISTGLFESR